MKIAEVTDAIDLIKFFCENHNLGYRGSYKSGNPLGTINMLIALDMDSTETACYPVHLDCNLLKLSIRDNIANQVDIERVLDVRNCSFLFLEEYIGVVEPDGKIIHIFEY